MDRANLRAGDDDRRRVADELQQHYVAGRLSSEELTERVQKANAARTFGDLDALTADLPPLPSPVPASPVGAAAPLPAPVDDAVSPWERKDVRANATSYVLVMALLVAIWLVTTPGGYFWPIWPMLGWGFADAAHALARRRW
jgi:hypothetical protein